MATPRRSTPSGDRLRPAPATPRRGSPWRCRAMPMTPHCTRWVGAVGMAARSPQEERRSTMPNVLRTPAAPLAGPRDLVGRHRRNVLILYATEWAMLGLTAIVLG